MASSQWPPQGGSGSGTVTSVGLTVPAWLTVSGSPVTTSGTLAVSNATAPIQAPDVLTLLNASTSSSSDLVLLYVSTNAAGSCVLRLLKANGAYGSQTAVLNTNPLVTVAMGGYDSSVWKNSSNITATATEDWDTSHHGTSVVFNAVPTGSNNATARCTLAGDGSFTINAAAVVNSTLKSGNYNIQPGENNAGNSSTAQTINWTTQSAQLSTLTGNVTYTFSNPQTGGAYVLRIATGAGTFTMTWPGSVVWLNSGNTAPSADPTGGKTLIVNFYYDGTTYWGSYAGTY